MKYKYNGQWYDVSIKALDSLPVGSEIDFNGSSSDIPVGWTQGSNTQVVLYEDNSGTTGNVTLSSSSANYTYIDVYCTKSGCYSYQRIYSPNGKTFGINLNNVYGATSIQQIFATYTISGTTITKNYEIYMNDGGTPVISNDLCIIRVVGYK